jgi:transcriptional regulator GlxA family with amidase domain
VTLNHLDRIVRWPATSGQAAGHLTTSDLSLEAIARRTGYATNASLSKAFKREFGISPGGYRATQGPG